MRGSKNRDRHLSRPLRPFLDPWWPFLHVMQRCRQSLSASGAARMVFIENIIKPANVCSLLTNPLKVLKSAIGTANVCQFVYMATKMPFCGSLYPYVLTLLR